MKKYIIAALVILVTSCATRKDKLDHSGFIVENRIPQEIKQSETKLYKYYITPTNGLSRSTWFISPNFYTLNQVILFN